MVHDENGKIRQSTTVNINGLAWDVGIVASDNEALTDLTGMKCQSVTWRGEQRIVLSAMLNQRTARRVIALELTNAFIWATQAHIQKSYTVKEMCDFIACYGAQINRCADEVYAALFDDKGTGGAT